MKKGVLLFGVIFGLLMMSAPAFAANYAASWNAVDFAVCNSDPNHSGYRLYESVDNGATKTLLGEVPTGMTEYSFTRDSLNGVCLYATAFNQFGESGFSEPFCAKSPDVPNALKVLIQEIISALEKFKLQL
jgi:hypothetical protein